MQDATKRCPSCKLSKPISDFPRYGKKQSRRPYCPPCYNKLSNRGQRRRQLKHYYGITERDFDRILASQGGLCAICEKIGVWHIDHCHKTKLIRGILCSKCNRGIGLLGENREVLKNAIRYLSQPNER